MVEIAIRGLGTENRHAISNAVKDIEGVKGIHFMIHGIDIVFKTIEEAKDNVSTVRETLDNAGVEYDEVQYEGDEWAYKGDARVEVWV